MAIDDRLLRVLRILNAHGSMTVLDITRQADISRAAVYRILETLCKSGYVRRCPGTASFQLTWLVKTLSAGYREANLIEEAGSAAISWLQDQVRWPTSLGIPEKGYMLVRESTRFRSPFVFDVGGVGLKLPMYTSAMGLAYFAFVPQDTKEIILDINRRRNALQPPTRTQLRLIVERGWSIRHGGIQPKTASIAAPVFHMGVAVGAICVTYGMTALSQQKAIETIVPPLLEASRRVACPDIDSRSASARPEQQTLDR